MKTQVNKPFHPPDSLLLSTQPGPLHMRTPRTARARREGRKFSTNLFEFRRHLRKVPVSQSLAENTSSSLQTLRGPSLLLWQPPESLPPAKLPPFVTRPATSPLQRAPPQPPYGQSPSREKETTDQRRRSVGRKEIKKKRPQTTAGDASLSHGSPLRPAGSGPGRERAGGRHWRAGAAAAGAGPGRGHARRAGGAGSARRLRLLGGLGARGGQRAEPRGGRASRRARRRRAVPPAGRGRAAARGGTDRSPRGSHASRPAPRVSPAGL